MTKERLYIYDTTLRDGAQTEGVDFSIRDREKILAALDLFGVDYIEGGWPGANPTDTEFFRNDHSLRSANLIAFGMTKKTENYVENDPMLSQLVNSKCSSVCIFSKSWDFHVDVALGITHEQNLTNINETTKHIVKCGKECMFAAEHYFDGFKSNPRYALSCLKAAYDNGARWIILADTNGGTLPHEIFEIVSETTRHIPGKNLGIHTHNDTGNAVANSLAAVQAGVRQVQGTINGLGERCGNANLISLIATFLLKKDFSDKFELNIKRNDLKMLTQCSRLLDDILNREPNRHLPYVGACAFSHKGGIHASAVQKNPKTYEHINPQDVGNCRRIVVSGQSGNSNIMSRLISIGLPVKRSNTKLKILVDEIKQRELIGYSYDGADASFELLARRILGTNPISIQLHRYELSVTKQNTGEIISSVKAEIDVDGDKIMCQGEGNGPVNALENAIRSNSRYYEYFTDFSLVESKVKTLNTSTGAATRVHLQSTDTKGATWVTIGVSPNIIDSYFNALVESLAYKLLKDRVTNNLSGLSSISS